jgi:Spy/CpxP family protein refolding chaperone
MMKILLPLALTLSLIGGAAAYADPADHSHDQSQMGQNHMGDHQGGQRHRHQVCTWSHHHRHCSWGY